MENTAYHEAGHAFMATQLGGKVKSVTIDPDNDDSPERFGDTQVVWRQDRLSDREYRERAIRVSLAGPVAEMLYTGDPYHPGLVAEWANDWKNAWDLAEPLIPDLRRRLVYLEQTIGSLLGMGATTRQAKWRKVGEILLAWFSTVPCGAVLAAVAYWILSATVR